MTEAEELQSAKDHLFLTYGNLYYEYQKTAEKLEDLETKILQCRRAITELSGEIKPKETQDDNSIRTTESSSKPSSE